MNNTVKAELLQQERVVLGECRFAELVVWRLPEPLPSSAHNLKYRLAYVVAGQCVVRYDNEAGKGDHRHIGEQEMSYTFSTPAQLVRDFWADVACFDQS
jgi:adenosine/AMP kinase